MNDRAVLVVTWQTHAWHVLEHVHHPAARHVPSSAYDKLNAWFASGWQLVQGSGTDSARVVLTLEHG